MRGVCVYVMKIGIVHVGKQVDKVCNIHYRDYFTAAPVLWMKKLTGKFSNVICRRTLRYKGGRHGDTITCSAVCLTTEAMERD